MEKRGERCAQERERARRMRTGGGCVRSALKSEIIKEHVP